jgi:VWFA-related protein
MPESNDSRGNGVGRAFLKSGNVWDVPDFLHRILIWMGWFCFALMPALHSYENQVAPQIQAGEAGDRERGVDIRVAVQEVRVDAVVLDKNGHQITDLKVSDFELYQDGARQEITSCVYVTSSQAEKEKAPAAAKPSIPPSLLAPDQVRRAIAFVVDDLSMDFRHVYAARLALEKFVKNEMQPGDLVAILRTSRGIGALQLFSSDRRQLLAMIKSIRWGFYYGNLSQITAMSYCIRALRDVQARKYLILMSSRTALNGNMFPDSAESTQRGPDLNAFNLLADEALRAGVVIHSLDMTGLEGPFIMSQPTIDISVWRNGRPEIPLSKKTGGIFVKDSSFSIGRKVLEEMKGYYLLSYIPPEKTFEKKKRGVYHEWKLKVTRPGSEVHTRDGFFGLTEPHNDLASLRNPLREAIFSPFQYNDLKVNLAFGYIGDSPRGYLLRSWLHVDIGQLHPFEENDGSYSLRLNVACITSGFDDYLQDSGIAQYSFRIKKEHIEWLKKYGLMFYLSLPVKKPGAYYVRVAVEDPSSGMIGSAYQFIEIPDLKKDHLSLSSVFVINRDEDISWLRSGTADEKQQYLQPDLRQGSRRSPAFRSYLPGESFEYIAFIYNVKPWGAKQPDLEYQLVLYRNGSELYKSEAEPIDLSSVVDFKKITVSERLHIGEAMQPGDYVMLVQVRDKHANEKYSLASQPLDFEVLATQPNTDD